MFKSLLTTSLLALLLGSFSSCKNDLQPEVVPSPVATAKNRQARLPEEQGVDLKSTYFVRINGSNYFDGDQLIVQPGDILEVYHRQYFTEEQRQQDRSGEADTSLWEIPSNWTILAQNGFANYGFNDYKKFRVEGGPASTSPKELVLRHFPDNYDASSKIVRIQVLPGFYF